MIIKPLSTNIHFGDLRFEFSPKPVKNKQVELAASPTTSIFSAALQNYIDEAKKVDRFYPTPLKFYRKEQNGNTVILKQNFSNDDFEQDGTLANLKKEEVKKVLSLYENFLESWYKLWHPDSKTKA